jgi:hypothetical protein
LFSAFGDRSSPSERWQCFALAALEVEAEGGCVSEGCAVEASSSADADGWGPAHLTDGVRGSQLAGPSPQLRTVMHKNEMTVITGPEDLEAYMTLLSN